MVVKPNIGGSGAGVRRFETVQALDAAARAGALDLGVDQTALVQEFIPADQQRIVRVEVLGGPKLDQIRELLHIDGHGFLPYSLRPIHWLAGCGFPAAAANTFSVIFFTSGSVTSRPPRPQMKAINAGRFATG